MFITTNKGFCNFLSIHPDSVLPEAVLMTNQVVDIQQMHVQWFLPSFLMIFLNNNSPQYYCNGRRGVEWYFTALPHICESCKIKKQCQSLALTSIIPKNCTCVIVVCSLGIWQGDYTIKSFCPQNTRYHFFFRKHSPWKVNKMKGRRFYFVAIFYI